MIETMMEGEGFVDQPAVCGEKDGDRDLLGRCIAWFKVKQAKANIRESIN